jgi:hypothetical protein
LNPALRLTFGVDGRFASQDPGSGRLLGAELGIGFDVSPRVTLAPAVRWDTGTLDRGRDDVDLSGLGASVFIRIR